MKIEAALQAPTGSATTLLSIVSNLTGSETRKSRAMLPELSEKLNDIGQLSGGQIPLHGQLFAQWLHYVEPYKCTYPATVSAQANWYKLKALVTDEQRASYAATLSDAAPTPESAESNIITQWTNEESLPHQDDSIRDASERIETSKVLPKTSRASLRWAFMLAALISSLSVLWSFVRKAFQAYRHKEYEKDLLRDEKESTIGNKTAAVAKVTKGKSQSRKKPIPGQLSSVKTACRSGQSVAKEIPREPDDASPISPACDNDVSSLNLFAGETEPEDHKTEVQEDSCDVANADDATAAADCKTALSVKAESTEPELVLMSVEEVTDRSEDGVASADHQQIGSAADDIAGEHKLDDSIMHEASNSPMPGMLVERVEQRKAEKAAAAMDASARAAAARAAAAEAAAVAAAAAQSAAAAAAEAEALAAEAADAAAAAAAVSEDPVIHSSPTLQTETKQPDVRRVPTGFEVFERVGLLAPKKSSPAPGQQAQPTGRPSLVAEQPLLASFRPPPGLELPPPPGLEMLPPPGL